MMIVLVVKADLEYAPAPDRLELAMDSLRAKAENLVTEELRDLEEVSEITAYVRVFS